jgi:dinuclear metal center YbgI/SA1388 family protein
MNERSAVSIATHLDEVLATATTPDYDRALNGLQFENRSPVRRIAAAVDFSEQSIAAAIASDANLLIVHHGMYWSGTQRLIGYRAARIRLLVEHDVAVYSSHLPLDVHPTLGNNALLARELALESNGTFGRYETLPIGVRGDTDIATEALVVRVAAFAERYRTVIRVTARDPSRRTRRWAILTGAGADSQTLQEAESLGIDTMVVGEGPHHTAVEAPERSVVIIYAGHYATETLGVQALAQYTGERFQLPWCFVDAPTGL